MDCRGNLSFAFSFFLSCLPIPFSMHKSVIRLPRSSILTLFDHFCKVGFSCGCVFTHQTIFRSIHTRSASCLAMPQFVSIRNNFSVCGNKILHNLNRLYAIRCISGCSMMIYNGRKGRAENNSLFVYAFFFSAVSLETLIGYDVRFLHKVQSQTTTWIIFSIHAK